MSENIRGLLIESFTDLVDVGVGDPLFPETLADEVRSLDQSSLDFLVVLDTFGTNYPGAPSQVQRPDPLIVTAHLAMSTDRLGFAIQAPVELLEPFSMAKVYQSLDHLSGGRIAMCISGVPNADALQALDQPHPGASKDFSAYASEFVTAIRKLWDSWEAGAIVRDKERGIYLDPERVHRVNHEGENFSIRGPSLTPKSPQGRPPVVAYLPEVESASTGVDADATLTPCGDHFVVQSPALNESIRVFDGRAGGYLGLKAEMTAADGGGQNLSFREMLNLSEAENSYILAGQREVERE